MDFTLRDTLETTAKKHPSKDALIYPAADQRWTYEELNSTANRLATVFSELGIEKGDRVSTLLSNGPEIALTVFACAKLGAVFNPLNYRLSTEQVQYILNDAGAELLVFEDVSRAVVEAGRDDFDTVEAYLYAGDTVPQYATGFFDSVRSVRDRSPSTNVEGEDPYAILYTSGTTGRPKGVVHDHQNIVTHNLQVIATDVAKRTSTGLSAFPLYHAGELHGGLLVRVHVGATSVIHSGFDPVRVLEDIERYDVTVLIAPPTGWNALLQTLAEIDVDVSSLQLGIYASAPMPGTVLEGVLDTFDAGFLQAYGMTEIGGAATYLYPEDQREKQGSAGTPGLVHDLRIVEPDGDPPETLPRGEIGEILLASPCTMQEYWSRPETTAEVIQAFDGKKWYYTGDLGYLDEDGYLYVVDRKDDLIISGGENIYPTNIEDVLYSHPDVVEAAVIGEPHEKWGERVVAYVVGETTATELDRHVRDSDAIADFKRPRKYYFGTDLPTNPSGKIQKFKLRSDGTDFGFEGQEL